MSDILLRFVHISDTHISHDPAYISGQRQHPTPAARALVEQVNAVPFTPDFVLHTGDVAYDPQEPAYALARDILGGIRWPVYYLAGNHDDARMLQRVFLARDTVQPEWYYTFECGGVQIVCLDSTGPAPEPSGTVSEAQLNWLRAITEADDPRPLVVAVHHNTLQTGVPWLDTFMRMANGDALHAALLPARDRLRGVFYGHIHQNNQTTRDGILYSSVLSSWYQIQSWPEQTDTVLETDAEPGFNVVTITTSGLHIRHHRYSLPAADHSH
jgi:3',5'-cyclic AMP phosphodiesterase CpdA